MSTADRIVPYLPRLAVTWSHDHPDRRWVELDGSLVFVDISGFTALSERLARRGRVGAEELTAALGSCFAELLAVAYAAGGSLLKFGGDALLLLFDGDDHAVRACTSAIAMRRALRQAGRLKTSVGPVRLSMSVGVHSGPVHVFRLGESHRELVITGPAATTVASMEATADAGEILVSLETAARVPRRFVGAAKGPGQLLRNVAVDAPGTGFDAVPAASDDLVASIPAGLRRHLVDGSVESEHRHVNVGFVHFGGVDRLLAALGPEAIADAVEGLVVATQHAADDEGVCILGSDVAKDGGKLILVTGAPDAREDDAGRMLRAVRRVADHATALDVRIGVNAGHVFAGEIGPGYRRTFTVMGDAVNLAARLMAKAEPGQIVATLEPVERSATAFATESLAAFAVKGKSEPITAVAVGGALGRRHTADAAVLPFVGRDAVLGDLVAVAERAHSGAGAVVDITGDPGMGKTRLLDELVATLRDVTVVRAVAEPYETRTPYFVGRQLVLAALGVDHDATGEAVREAVARRAPALVDWLPVVGEVVGIAYPETDHTVLLEPRFRRERAHWAVAELLTTVPGPVVIAVDDAQWMDAASAGLVAKLAAVAVDRPWLVCIARRNSGDDPPVSALVRIDLTALDPVDVATAVSAVTMDEPLPPHHREAIVRQAGGNPRFVDALVRARVWLDPDAALPATVEDLVAIEIDRLPPADRRLLRYAAVLGTTFAAGLVTDADDTGRPPTVQALVRRLRPFVISAGRGRVRFVNQSVRDVAYEQLPFRRRRELHARAAFAIEGGGDTDRAAGSLSLHFLHAGEFDRCWRYATRAAELAAAKFANVECADLYERALSVRRHVGVDQIDEADVWERLGDAAQLAGMFARASKAYGRARRLRREQPAALARLCGKESRLAALDGRTGAAARWIRRGLSTLTAASSPEELCQRAELRAQFAFDRQRQGDSAGALRWCKAAIDEALESEARRALALAYMVLDWAHIDLSHPELATNGATALEIWEEVGDTYQQATLLNNMGGFAYLRGDWEEAVDLYREARERNVRIGDLVRAASAACNVSEILIDQGHLDEAEPGLHEAIDLWRAVGFAAGVASARGFLARLALRRGEVERALRLLDEAKAQFEAEGLAAYGVEADAWIAECELRLGRVADAERRIDDLLSGLDPAHTTTCQPMLFRLRACLAVVNGRVDGAWADFNRSLEVARARGAKFEIALTLDALAAVTELAGLPPDAAAEEERAALLAALGVRATPPPPLPAVPALTPERSAKDHGGRIAVART